MNLPSIFNHIVVFTEVLRKHTYSLERNRVRGDKENHHTNTHDKSCE